MPVTKDLRGLKFGRLTPIKISGKSSGTNVWECVCDCGNITNVVVNSLTMGKTKSCGCLAREKTIERNIMFGTVHGKSQTALYRDFRSMKQRCYNPNDKDYKNYGGRGIKICAEWKENYLAFFEWAKANGQKKGLSIERINNDGDYCPENCRWATPQEQANNKRTNHYIEINGEVHSLMEWCRITGAKKTTVYDRIRRGWKPERLFDAPLCSGGKGSKKHE